MSLSTHEIFASLDARRAAAAATIAQYTAAQAAEASRVARLYDNCAVSSLKHAEDTARQLREIFGAPVAKMNKTETREALKAAQYAAAGFPDMAARTLSMLHRAAMRASSKARLLQAARDIGVADHPEFII